jgi:hypothetical protein
MREVTDQDRQMRQFLLDKLDPHERERIEEQFMLDRAFKEQLLMAEESLIEDYLDNVLDEADRKRFDSVFFSSSEQREKLAIARAIRATAKAEITHVSFAGEADLLKRDEIIKTEPPARSSRFMTALKVAAVVLVVIGIFWLVQRYLENAEQRAKREAIQAELAELNSGSHHGSELAQTIVLAPINTRASGPPSLSRGTGVSVFELWLLPTSLENVNYKASIKKDGERLQFEVSSLLLVDTPQGRAVRLRIPTHLLNTGAYQVELSAVGPNGEPVYAGEYRFQIAD